LQEPDRSPTTAIYLEQLLASYAEDPLPGESFVVLRQAGLADPTASHDRLRGLAVAGRRALPPTRLLRAGSLTTDPFVLRSGSIGASWRAGRSGAEGAVFHTAGGAVPIASWLPVVVTLLDLAPWELPEAYQRSPAARFGQRLRARILRDATRVIVPSAAAASATHRLLHVRTDRLRVVALAPRPEFRPEALGAIGPERDRFGIPERYLVYPGRYDARQDLATLLQALSELAAAGVPSGSGDVAWPPRLLLVDATPGDRAEVARAAARFGVGELVSYVPHLEAGRLAAVVAASRAAVIPVLTSTAGVHAIEAMAAGIPVVANAVGSLPEVVGAGGLLVEPRDPSRLAAALRTVWSDDTIRGRLVAAAGDRLGARPRAWADVAAETRAIYAEAAGEGDPGPRAR
jgi:glycosyltransferase involved in cell wall biosynthesis